MFFPPQEASSFDGPERISKNVSTRKLPAGEQTPAENGSDIPWSFG